MALPGAPLSSMTGKRAIRRIEQPFWRRIAALTGLVVVGLAVPLALDPIPQNPAYHVFADRRPLAGIPNFNDVVSNAGFAAVGVLGILVVAGRRRREIFAHGSDPWPYIVFFVGVALVSLGSAYYHWAPSNDRLLWDRLPCRSRSWRSARRSSPTGSIARRATFGSWQSWSASAS